MGATAEEVIEYRVASATPVSDLASFISHTVYDGKLVTLRAIGAGAVHQAIKGAAAARGYVAPRGVDLLIKPGFFDTEMPNRNSGEPEKVTGILLKIVVV